MTGKKKSKKGRKTQVGDQEPASSAGSASRTCDNLAPDAAAAAKKSKKGRKTHVGDQEPASSAGSVSITCDNLAPDAAAAAKKSKKGRKTHVGDQEPASSAGSASIICDNLAPDAAAAAAAGDGRLKRPETTTSAAASSNTTAIAVEGAHTASLLDSPRGRSGLVDSEPLSQLADAASSKEAAKSLFVFSAGQTTLSQERGGPLSSAQPAADSTTSTIVSASRSARPSSRRRDMKCPPSERFGKLGSKSRHQNSMQLAAQAVAFGQGRDPLSLVVSYEENGLRRIVKAPDGCTSDTIVDTTLRQAVAGTALDSSGWQEALNHPREDSYFTYSTVPEGLTIAKFRDNRGKILVTPLSAESGLLKLKEDAEKKRKAAEEVLENVRKYLQRLKSEDEECSREKSSNCAHCRSFRTQLDDLLGLVKQPTSVDLKKTVDTANLHGKLG